MKKLIALLLACVMVLGMAACGAADAGTTTAAGGNNDAQGTTTGTAEPEAVR